MREQLGRVTEIQVQSAAYSALTKFPLPDLTSFVHAVQQEPGDYVQPNKCQLINPDIYRLLALFEVSAYQSYLGSPNVDHRLTLVKLNVFRAFQLNITSLGWSLEGMTDDALSPFSNSGPCTGDCSQSLLPASLRPTPLQQSQSHHPWLDFFPFPRLRDNLIIQEEHVDDSQLCRDLMGFWSMPSEEDNCMLVWGDPWDPMNWEVTELFLQKWGWAVTGCREIIWSSNFWREKRGQKKLTWKKSFC